MRKHTPFFCLILFVIVFACDTHEASFEDSINPLFTLTTNVIPEEGGTISPSAGNFTEGVDIQIEASPSDGFVFDRWEGDLTGSNNPDTIIVDDEKFITAIFKEETLGEGFSLAVNTEGAGSVEKDPDKASYLEREEVILRAVAETGWTFKQWKGDLSGSSTPETITVDGDKSVTAVFEQDLVIVISVEEVKLYIDEMELSGFRRTRDFKTKNFILNIPLDGSPFKITHTEIPPGLYDELELEIEKPEDKNNVGDSDFWLGNRSFSLVVRGIYRGEGFIFRSDEDFEIEVDINPPLSITEGQNSIIPLIADFESWFKDSNGDILDPNDSNNKDKINKNIEDSFSNF
ncbi:MAG: hypothetical protein ACFCU6_10095 [Balneolaceae bacterium]